MKGLRPSIFLDASSMRPGFYLVTWMKGLRLSYPCHGCWIDFLVFTLWPEWRDYDARSSIFDASQNSKRFYLVTWMKGLRPLYSATYIPLEISVFTLWPEWRDYDRYYAPPSGIIERLSFYLVTWMKGLRQILLRKLYGNSIMFLPCDLNEGITTWTQSPD